MRILAALALLLLPAGVSAEEAESWRILEGEQSRIAAPRTAAVTDPAAWAKIWKEHTADAPLPPVDFTEENVVAVFLGDTMAAGVKIVIIVHADPIDANRLNVFYREVRPASAPLTGAVISRPYAMIKVRKTAVVSIESDRLFAAPERYAAPINPRNAAKVRALLELRPSFD